MAFIFQPWPWYVAGPLIALVMFLLLLLGKNLGMSSNLRTLCSIGGAGKWADFFQFNWKQQIWNLMVLVGVVIGGFVAANFLSQDAAVELNPETVTSLNEMGFEHVGSQLVPEEIFGTQALFSVEGLLILVVGGLLIGFGARYAGGCTSGHAISGLSNLQVPSLIAVVGFFIGGLMMSFFIFPYLFG